MALTSAIVCECGTPKHLVNGYQFCSHCDGAENCSRPRTCNTCTRYSNSLFRRISR